jgi:hypothetical protein
VAVAGGFGLRRTDRFLRLLSETIDVHTTYFDSETARLVSASIRIGTLRSV